MQGLPPQLSERAHALNDTPVDERADFVLCWLHHAIRGHDNPALDAAVHLANQLGKPALVYQGLAGRHRFNSDRHHVFIMQGARDLARELGERSIAYAFHLPRDPGAPSPLRNLIARACAVVTEDFPAPPFPDWSRAHAARSRGRMLAVDTACLFPVRSLEKPPTRAFEFRRAARGEWDRRIARAWEDVQPVAPPFDTGALGFEAVDLATADPDELAAACDIDHAIPPVRHTTGGSTAGYARWDEFRERGLKTYADRRNDASDLHAVSRLSPWLHHGHVSPLRIAREAREIGGEGAEKFLDELLTWREMGHHWAAERTTERLETLEAVPGWARQTLEAHASDEREAVYTWETLSRARTDDELWNGAQRSLLWSGELHNNLRMTWGKMIPQWTRTPDEALRLLIDLNHRYALDGNNPNSYAGLLWCLGLFDRPFTPEQPVLGAVRPRDTRTHARRLDPKKYSAAVRTRAGHVPLRIAVVGAGIAGLACARTLADHACTVRVFDKGRGPGGRCATRFADDDRFDHGCPWFEVTDPRFGRFVKSWAEAGVAAVWKGAFARVNGRGLAPITPERARVVGTPGMHALCAHLGHDLDVAHTNRITGLVRTGAGWQLDINDERSDETFDRVVVAVPPAQARALLGDAAPALAAAAGDIETTPRWTLMLTLAGEAAPFDALTFNEGPLEMILRNDTKPGRERTPGRRRWVAHASPAWSIEHLEEDAGRIASAMTGLVREYLDAGDVLHAAAHRWRYARTAHPTDERCVYDDHLAVALCGDGFGGAGVEAAFLSGQAAAGRILASRAHAPAPAGAATLFAGE